MTNLKAPLGVRNVLEFSVRSSTCSISPSRGLNPLLNRLSSAIDREYRSNSIMLRVKIAAVLISKARILFSWRTDHLYITR